jgi:hypothetical protein
VPSCDAYADLWRPFFSLFWRYWPDCPFPVYLGTNDLTFADSRVVSLRSDQGTNWANRVRNQLEALREPYVLLILEDFFFRDRVATPRMLELLQWLAAQDGRMLRLVNRPPPDAAIPGNPSLGSILPGAPYRLSTQAAFWHRETLLALMKANESIWEFEVAGSRRSDALVDGFYSTWRQELPYGYHVVERGKWFRHAARRFVRQDIGVDLAARPVMSRREAWAAQLDWCKSWLMHRFPWPLRVRIQSLANKAGL